MDGECPISTVDLADTFIPHSDSFSGSLEASCVPQGAELRSRWLTLSPDFGVRLILYKVDAARGLGRDMFMKHVWNF